MRPKNTKLPLLRYSIILITIWTVGLAASLAWNIVKIKQDSLERARMHARNAFDKDILYRRWNSEHGGIYAPVTEKTPPNPYLDVEERDILTPLGRKLTMINPAYMTRQIYEMSDLESGIVSHITSLKPIRPENKADLWETDALKAVEQSETNVSSMEIMDGKEYMRVMYPLVTERSCMKCHEHQGYTVGDIRGGISISVPMEQIWQTEGSLTGRLIFFHSLLWLIGVTIIAWGSVKLERSEHQRRQAEDEMVFRSFMLDSASDSIFVHDLEGNIVYANEAFCTLRNCNRDGLKEITVKNLEEVKQAAFFDRRIKMIEKKRQISFETTHVLKDKRVMPVEVHARMIELSGKKLILNIARDIGERKKFEEKLRHLSATDGLTGLANRRVFNDSLAEEWRRAQRRKSSCCLIMIDIDFFKNYNDHYGHLAGDDCLRKIGKLLLKSTRRAGDLAVRYGGEEFAILLPDTDIKNGVSIAEKIKKKVNVLNIPHADSKVSNHVTVSMGVASVRPEPDMQPTSLVNMADKAMYRAKDNGRNRIEMYS